jgi:hypothetical protein
MTIKVKSNTRTTYTISTSEFPNVDFEVSFQPYDSYDPGAIQFKKLSDEQVCIGYLSHDSDASNPLEDSDGMGRIYSSARHSNTQRQMQEALGLDSYWNPDGSDPAPYAILLDVYDHGGQVFSISGNGMQCRFDTARGGAVWVPDQCCLDHIMSLPEADRQAEAIKDCQAALEVYNAWLSGDTYGICFATCELDTGKEIESDECWGYYTSKYAIEEMKGQLG